MQDKTSKDAPIPTELNIAPRGKSWLHGQLIDGEQGHPTRQSMESTDRAQAIEAASVVLAAPAAVAVPDVRKAFEAWASGEGYSIKRWQHGPEIYDDNTTDDAWRVWQACAALAATPAAAAPDLHAQIMNLPLGIFGTGIGDIGIAYRAGHRAARLDAAELVSSTLASQAADAPMVNMTPPATSRDRWMYEQGRLAERDARTHGSVAADAPTVPKWIDDPHDIEQGQMLNPEWVKLQESDAPPLAFLPFSARSAIAARHGMKVTAEFNALVREVIAEYRARVMPSDFAADAPVVLPAGWVPCTVTYEGQHPEEVAYGPQIMMDRLKKWIERYFALKAAAPVVLPEPVAWRHSRTYALHDTQDEVQLADADAHAEPLFTEQQVRALLAGVSAPAAQAGFVPAAAYDRLQALCDSQAARILAVEDANPVHWLAVLDPEQVSHQLKTSMHAVGFRNPRSAESWIAERLDFDGWRYTLEPLYSAPQAQADARDAARYRFIVAKKLILSGGTEQFDWPIAPFGNECDRYIDAAIAAQAAQQGGA